MKIILDLPNAIKMFRKVATPCNAPMEFSVYLEVYQLDIRWQH